jgi:branched-chain amino acid transport system permease protein
MEIFGVPLQAMMSQLLLGLVNGSFYAMLSLGLAVIFGLLNVINFSHGALYMMGAFLAWIGVTIFGLNYWDDAGAGAAGGRPVRHRDRKTMLRWLYKLDHLYGLLLTFGITLLLEGVFRSFFGVSGQPSTCRSCCGATDLGFMILPNYRAWVVVASLVVCLAAPGS